MEIEINTSLSERLRDVTYGSVFVYKGIHYIKINNTSYSDYDDHQAAVKVETWKEVELPKDEKVIVCKAKLTIGSQ